MSLITSPPDRVRDAQAQVPPRGNFGRRAAKERLTAGWPTGRQQDCWSACCVGGEETRVQRTGSWHVSVDSEPSGPQLHPGAGLARLYGSALAATEYRDSPAVTGASPGGRSVSPVMSSLDYRCRVLEG